MWIRSKRILATTASLTILLRASNAFSSTSTQSLVCQTATPTRATLRAGFGELSISEPSELENDLIEAASIPLPWEPTSTDTKDIDWEDGQYWFETRQSLMNLWVLPRDMSNGSWENYKLAANRGEHKILQLAPQLLRLKPLSVLQSAKTVLKELKLPPAVLRNEPILLAMESERILGGWEQLKKQHDDSEDAEASVRAACRDAPYQLVEAARDWIHPNLSP